MKIYLRLAWRNIWRHRRRTMIVVLGIGMGMGLMMWYDGMIAGFEQAIYGNAIKVLGGNIQVNAHGYRDYAGQSPLLPLENDLAVVQVAEAQPQVLSATRRIVTTGMVSSRKGAFPVSILGIEPQKEALISLVAAHMVEGRYLAADDEAMILIGRGLADVMNVGLGDRVTLVGRTVGKEMRQHKMTVVGIYDLGLRDIEKRTVYISLAQAQFLYGLDGQSTDIVISLQKIGQEPAVMKAMAPLVLSNEIASWETSFPDMQNALGTKNGVMNIFSVIILVIAGIGILNLLLMAIYERTREIGLLGALGMKPRQISLLFLVEGALMGLVGLAFGVALGLVINITIGQVGLDYSQFANLTEYTALISGRVYTTLGFERLPQRALTVLIISLLASYYPAHEASRREPAEALHFV